MDVVVESMLAALDGRLVWVSSLGCERACPTPPLGIEFTAAHHGRGLVSAAMQPCWRGPWAPRGWALTKAKIAKLSPRELGLQRSDGRGHLGLVRHGRYDP